MAICIYCGKTFEVPNGIHDGQKEYYYCSTSCYEDLIGKKTNFIRWDHLYPSIKMSMSYKSTAKEESKSMEESDRIEAATYEKNFYGHKIAILHLKNKKEHSSFLFMDHAIKRTMKVVGINTQEDMIKSLDESNFIDDLSEAFNKTYNFLLDDIEAITIAIDRNTKEWAWSVCRKPDQFSKKTGRVIALNRLAEKKVNKCSLGIRVKRIYKDDFLYLVPTNKWNEFCESTGIVDRYPDLREELGWEGLELEDIL